jgi:hypothetical protein
MGRTLRNRDSEEIASMRTNINILPKPHIFILALDSIETELTEQCQTCFIKVSTCKHTKFTLLVCSFRTITRRKTKKPENKTNVNESMLHQMHSECIYSTYTKITVFWKKFTKILEKRAVSIQKANDEDEDSRFFQNVDKFLTDYMI